MLRPFQSDPRTALFLLAFVVFAVWETFLPRRVAIASTARRWTAHAALWFISDVGIGWIYRASVVVTAAAVSGSRYGLLNREIAPFWARCIVAVLLLDLVRYGQHYLYHSVGVLWRIHQVHHADLDYDWSTGLRFHPVEALLTQGSYLAVVAALAPPPAAVFGLEMATIAVNLFVHANIAPP